METKCAHEWTTTDDAKTGPLASRICPECKAKI